MSEQVPNSQLPGSPEITGLQTPVQFLRGVGPHRAILLKNLNIHTVGDLLLHVPHEIHDFSCIRSVPQLQDDQLQAVHGVVVDRDARELRGGRSLVGVLLNCEGHFVRGTWFNQPWIFRKYTHGQRLIFQGKPQRRAGRWEFSNPSVILLAPEDEVEAGAGVLPRYALTEGISMDAMRRMTRTAAEQFAELATDPLPQSLREQLRIPTLPEALRGLHIPTSPEQWQAARRRVLLDDLLEFQLGLALRRRRTRAQKAVPLPVTAKIDARIRRLFSFRFTAGQDQAVQDLCRDLQMTEPMHRLLQADVGAGKTAIAVYALLLAVAAGHQAALMAPTEVLAAQHWDTLEELLQGSRVQRCLLLGGLPAARRRELLNGIASGEISLIIGTQALIQESVRFQNLALTVIDEQHRFGVRQRSHFSTGQISPHVLIMTATPIPRSLCLTQFGDLDISVIKDLPPGRQKVITSRISSAPEQSRVWLFVRQQVAAGRQAYVVCPRVEGQAEDDQAAAESVFRTLQATELAGLRIELLHGRMDREHRHAVMDRFRERTCDVLVTTTVIEVGVNIPNATLMIIQQAERFGLAQLHQLRGRICRGSHQGFCFLFSDSEVPDSVARLTAMEQSTDGFTLAEKDAELRGPGDILGLRQSGAMPLRCADPVRDLALLQETRDLAVSLVDSGTLDQTQFEPLKQIVLQRFTGLLDLPQTG
jgi:ATP-dependent DNA helicase RecG